MRGYLDTLLWTHCCVDCHRGPEVDWANSPVIREENKLNILIKKKKKKTGKVVKCSRSINDDGPREGSNTRQLTIIARIYFSKYDTCERRQKVGASVLLSIQSTIFASCY